MIDKILLSVCLVLMFVSGVVIGRLCTYHAIYRRARKFAGLKHWAYVRALWPNNKALEAAIDEKEQMRLSLVAENAMILMKLCPDQMELDHAIDRMIVEASRDFPHGVAASRFLPPP